MAAIVVASNSGLIVVGAMLAFGIALGAAVEPNSASLAGFSAACSVVAMGPIDVASTGEIVPG